MYHHFEIITEEFRYGEIKSMSNKTHTSYSILCVLLLSCNSTFAVSNTTYSLFNLEYLLVTGTHTCK